MLEAVGLAVTPPGAAFPAVRDVTLRVRPGEWVALVGENGGGKSSLLLALAGLWPCSAGTLALDGAAFGPGHRSGAPGVAVVLQDPSSQLLQPTVAEELAFTARNLGRSAVEVERELGRWLPRLGLDVDPGLDPATLSAGRQQLVLLVAALVTRPRLLLADEPTAHLDAATRGRVRAAIGDAVREGLGVVWATQDDDEAAAATRRVTVGTAAGAAPGGRDPLRPGLGETPAFPGPESPARRRAAAALTLEVTPTATEHGPRIRLRAPLTIEVGGGGATAVLGPNGAGKSVLLAAAAGLVETPQVRRHWAHPPRRPPIMALQYPELQVFEDRVADELAFAAVARGMSRETALSTASNYMEYLGLDPVQMLHRHTWSLSTGEKRLIEVVGTLIAPAGLVLLDEPTAGLDGVRRLALGELVRRRAEHDPLLVASQDRGWVERTVASRFELG